MIILLQLILSLYLFIYFDHDLADSIPPVVTHCGQTINDFYLVPIGIESRSVSWSLPRAYDNSGTVILQSSTHVPGSSFHLGSTEVSYRFTDLAENVAYCNFTVTIRQGKMVDLFYVNVTRHVKMDMLVV